MNANRPRYNGVELHDSFTVMGEFHDVSVSVI